MDRHIAALRADFDARARGSLSLPIAGAGVWGVVALVSLAVPPPAARYVLLFATGAIFPAALVIARLRGEALLDNRNPLARLMGASVLMVNLLWALHLTVLVRAPEYLPLTLGVGLGLHWVVFSWVTGHPVGVVHAVARTALVTGAWWLAPEHGVTMVAAAVVLVYAYSIHALARRPAGPTFVPEHSACLLAAETAGR